MKPNCEDNARPHPVNSECCCTACSFRRSAVKFQDVLGSLVRNVEKGAAEPVYKAAKGFEVIVPRMTVRKARGITRAAKLSAADELTLAENFRAAFAMLARAEPIRFKWQAAEDCLMSDALELRYWYVEADL